MAGPAMPLLARANEAAASALGESRFEAAFEAGRSMGREAALRIALSESEEIDTDPSDQVATGHWRSGRSRWRGWLPKA
jgi:hypothetical protein